MSKSSSFNNVSLDNVLPSQKVKSHKTDVPFMHIILKSHSSRIIKLLFLVVNRDV